MQWCGLGDPFSARRKAKRQAKNNAPPKKSAKHTILGAFWGTELPKDAKIFGVEGKMVTFRGGVPEYLWGRSRPLAGGGEG